MAAYRNRTVGSRFSFVLTGTTTNTVWGNLVYTDDSSLSSAAVHAGVLTAGQTGVVVVEIASAPTTDYRPVVRNGISSRFWSGSWPWAYKFVAGVTPPIVEEYILDAVDGNDVPINSVNEGQGFYFRLRTRNVAGGTVIPYTLSGFNSNDVKDAYNNPFPSVGNIVVSYVANGDSVNARGSVYAEVVADAVVGDNNNVTMTLNNGKATKTVAIRDTSPSYVLTANAASINEGQTLIVTLTTTNVANNTVVPYTITSPQGLDIFRGVPYALSTPHPMNGNFLVQNGSATQSFEIKNDQLTEGTETFTIRLNNNLATLSVPIYDTSRAPPRRIIRPPLIRVPTATMVLRCERGQTPPLAGWRPSTSVYSRSIGQYRYAIYGRILAVDFNIKNAPLFSTFTPVLSYSTNLVTWTAIPNRRSAFTTLNLWSSFRRFSWLRRRWPLPVTKQTVVGPIGANTSANANYRLIDVGHYIWQPSVLTYLTTSPPYFQEKFSFWPFYPQTNRTPIYNTARYLKIALPDAVQGLDFIFRLY